MDLRVAMTVSDRPFYLKDTLPYWANARNVQDVPFTFHVEQTVAKYQNLTLIKDWAYEAKIQRVAIVENSSRLGVLVNPWEAFELAFADGADFVLLCEEDTPVSSDVLEYFTWAAVKFQFNSSVLGACSWCPCLPEQYSASDCILASDFNPLVWGTWRDRWYDTLRDTWDKDYSSGNPDGSQAGWDWQIRLRILGDRKFVFPLQSRSDHIGYYGTHMLPKYFDESRAASFLADRPETLYKLVDSPTSVR